MIANFLRIDSFEKFPKEIQTQIFQNLVGQDSNIFFTKKAYRKDYINSLQAETDQKMGFYGKSLQLEKIKYFEKKEKLEIELAARIEFHVKEIEIKEKEYSTVDPDWSYAVQALFYNAIENRQGKSALLLNYMNLEATSQLESLSEVENEKAVIFEKKVPLSHLLHNGSDSKLKEKFALEAKLRSKLESMKYELKDLFELKFNENRIFDIVGGKDKFHALNILDIPNNCSYYSEITKLEKRQSVMRGVFAHRPFIAFCFSTGNSATRKVAFYYRNNDHYKEWKVNGTGHQLFEYNSYDKVENLEERIVKDLKQLITKGYFHKINSSYYLFAEDGSPQYS